MQTSSVIDEANPKISKFARLVGLLGKPWFRVSLLGSVCVLELVLTHFLLRMGWLAALDWGTQLAIVALIASPLLLALLVVAGKRFRLSSLLVAISLIGVFLSFVMIPVNNEVKARSASSKIKSVGATVGSETHYWAAEIDEKTGFTKPFRIEPSTPADWIRRIAPINLDILRDDEIVELSFEDDKQITETVPFLASCSHLTHITFGPLVSKSGIDLVVQNTTDDSPLRSICVGNFTGGIELDLSGLAEIDTLEDLFIFEVVNACQQISELEFKKLKRLTVIQQFGNPDADWAAFFASKTVQNLESLALRRADLTNRNAKHLASLKKLTSLGLQNVDIDELGFLHELPNIECLFLYELPLAEQAIDDLDSAKKLRWLYIRGCTGLNKENAEYLKKALPNCKIFIWD